MSRTYLLSLTLLLVLSVVSSQRPKPRAEHEGSFVYEDEETEEADPHQMTSRTTNPDLKSKVATRHGQTAHHPPKQIKKFTIQNIFKVSPPKQAEEESDPDLKSYFKSAKKTQLKDKAHKSLKTEKSRDNDIDMTGLVEETRAEVRRVVREALFRADRLYESIGGGMSSNQERSNMIMGRAHEDDRAESWGGRGGNGRGDYEVQQDARLSSNWVPYESQPQSQTWNNGNPDMKSFESGSSSGGKSSELNSSEMEEALTQATAAISTVKQVDDRILRMLQGDDKCH